LRKLCFALQEKAKFAMASANGKTALITGSTDGVGRVVAERLGQDGWRVLVHGRDRARGEQVVSAINAGGGPAEFLQADISAFAEVRRLADAVQRTTERLNLLINNAGIGSGGPQGTRQTSADGHELRFALASILSMLLFATGVATAALLIAAHDRPFIGEISVSPDPLLQVMPQPEG
jgi:NAD(P)-dependent dehydrogenase (short-subunit alcohol dehydrogenase family)